MLSSKKIFADLCLKEAILIHFKMIILQFRFNTIVCRIRADILGRASRPVLKKILIPLGSNSHTGRGGTLITTCEFV